MDKIRIALCVVLVLLLVPLSLSLQPKRESSVASRTVHLELLFKQELMVLGFISTGVFIEQSAVGSGFEFEPGMILTAGHCASIQLKDLRVMVRNLQTGSSEVREFKVVAVDELNDVALLARKDINNPHIQNLDWLGKDLKPTTKIKLTSIGYPGYVVDKPIMRTAEGPVVKLSLGRYLQNLTTTLHIVGGMSGGPVVDENDKVVGVNSTGLNPFQGSTNGEYADRIGVERDTILDAGIASTKAIRDLLTPFLHKSVILQKADQIALKRSTILQKAGAVISKKAA